MTENVIDVLVKGQVAAQGTVAEIRQQVEKARVLSVTLSGDELLRWGALGGKLLFPQSIFFDEGFGLSCIGIAEPGMKTFKTGSWKDSDPYILKSQKSVLFW